VRIALQGKLPDRSAPFSLGLKEKRPDTGGDKMLALHVKPSMSITVFEPDPAYEYI